MPEPRDHWSPENIADAVFMVSNEPNTPTCFDCGALAGDYGGHDAKHPERCHWHSLVRVLKARDERRAGLSPIARTEIERVVAEMRDGADDGTCLRAKGSTIERWAAALDSVLGAASTKEGL